MSCLVKLFEPNSATPPVHIDLTDTGIELVAVNEATKANCCNVEKNQAHSGGLGWGADLQFSKDSIPYQVAISDPNGVYGGATISRLSGTTDGDLDVVLEKLPRTRSTSGRAGSAAQARQAVMSELSWHPGEKQAVLSTMIALGSLRGTTAPPVIDFIRRYEVALENLGIDYSLF